MLTPNHNILTWEGVTYGLHQFEKNGPYMLCRQHSSGDWQTSKLATEHQVAYMTLHGKRLDAAPAKKVEAK